MGEILSGNPCSPSGRVHLSWSLQGMLKPGLGENWGEVPTCSCCHALECEACVIVSGTTVPASTV